MSIVESLFTLARWCLIKHPEHIDFKKLPQDIREVILVGQAPRTAILLTYPVCPFQCDNCNAGADPVVVSRYENVRSVLNLSFRIMNDPALGKGQFRVGLFHNLIKMHHDVLAGRPILEQMRMKPYRNNGVYFSWACTDVDPKEIVYLYTKILEPKQLLKDIHQVGRSWRFHICYEDETTWALMRKFMGDYSDLGH